jgi:hypothetical protein
LKIPPTSIPTSYLIMLPVVGVNGVEFGRQKEKVLRVTMDRLYDILVQIEYFPRK